MAHIRTWQDILDRGGDDWLTEAEKKLIEHCKAGQPCILGDGTLPPEGAPTPIRELRADVLRYLILGGCQDCMVNDIGVAAAGGHVTGVLDLGLCTVKGALRLLHCRFDQRLDTQQTSLAMIDFSGSHLEGWHGPHLSSTGSVFLRNITATSTVAISGATIGGQLSCEGAKFKATEGHALNAQGVKVTDDVFLRNITANSTVAINGATIGGHLACEGAKFGAAEGDALNAQGVKVTQSVILTNITATSTVAINSATIGGQLACDGAKFEAAEGDALNAQGVKVTDHVFLRNITATSTVDINSATIGGQLACDGAKFEAAEGHALNAQGLRIEGGLIWRDVKHTCGPLDFNTAHFQVLADDMASWTDTGAINFDGMTYDRIVGATDARSRLEWLAKGSNWNGEFRPQPYTQLAKVLRAMGHDSDARVILMESDRLLGPPNRARLRLIPDGSIKVGLLSIWYDISHPLRWFFDFLFRWVAGYGHRPFRSVVALIALIILAILPAHFAWEAGDFAPNSAIIQNSPGWIAELDTENPAQAWAAKNAAGQDWETFNRYAYGFDVVIPIINFGQTEAWAPSTTRGPWGWNLWWLRWVLSAFGWIVTALGAAAITGLIRRD